MAKFFGPRWSWDSEAFSHVCQLLILTWPVTDSDVEMVHTALKPTVPDDLDLSVTCNRFHGNHVVVATVSDPDGGRLVEKAIRVDHVDTAD